MNLSFIGMSGAGKSTVGAEVAQQLGYTFFDVDREMETQHDAPLQQILDTIGEESFLDIQAQQIVQLGNIENTVIAPGGSVVYTEIAMEYLKQHTTVVYIQVDCATAKSRLELTSRGIVGLEGTSYEALFAERAQLYEAYADIVIQAEGKSVADITKEAITLLC